MEFAWALADLEAILTPEEQLALKYLLEDYTERQAARFMGWDFWPFRRKVIEPLQEKAKLCGLKPRNEGASESQKQQPKKS